MSNHVVSYLAPVLALGLAACGGGFTASGDVPSADEVNDLAQALAQGGFAGFGSVAGAPSRAPAVSGTSTIDYTGPCNGGGTVKLAGSMTANVNQTTNSGTIDFNYTFAPSGCQVTTAGGKTFTITSDPNLKVDGNFSFSSGTTSTFQGSLGYNGKFNWTSSDGRAGACGVDLTANYDFSFSSTSSTGSATLSGTVCGVTVTKTVNVSA